VKAIALGANAVMLGRAALYGLAARGETGVRDVIEMIRQETDRTLALIGCRSVGELDRSYVSKRPS
jgi:(S)-mandelate dehydrogenase